MLIPFDWSGQNGVYIEQGHLFTNQSWYSGILSFDGTYTSYPNRYGGHSLNVAINEIGVLPEFRTLPDSSSVISFFDYYRGDYVMEYDDVILVTVQYRLNAFGFMSSEDEALPGNYGSLDQVEALRYLRKIGPLILSSKNSLYNTLNKYRIS